MLAQTRASSGEACRTGTSSKLSWQGSAPTSVSLSRWRRQPKAFDGMPSAGEEGKHAIDLLATARCDLDVGAKVVKFGRTRTVYRTRSLRRVRRQHRPSRRRAASQHRRSRMSSRPPSADSM